MKQEYKVILSRIILPLLVCSFTGCAYAITQIGQRTAINSMKEASTTSEYSPFMDVMPVDEFNAYMEKIRKIRGTIVADPLGSYYFNFYNNGNDYGKFAIIKEYEALARSMFKEETGLLEPVYTISKQFELQPDWGKTKKIYNELSKIFKLLPMSETEEYHRLILKKIQDDIRRSISLDSAQKGEGRFYNTEYYDKVLSQFEGRAKFVISTSGDIVNFFVLPSWQQQNDDIKLVMAWYWKSNSFFRFYSFEIFKNLQTTGFDVRNGIASSSVTNIDITREKLKNDEQLLAHGIKKDSESVKKKRQEIEKTLATLDSAMDRLLNENIEHLAKTKNALQITGGIQTKPLE